MDLTPEELRKVTFEGTRLAKGYSMPEVDEFVEKVAAGIGELLDQLRSATERAARAEAGLTEGRTSDETVQRTLVHAQKLADAVLSEARQEAAAVASEAAEAANRLRARARDEGGAHVGKAREARAEAERLRAEAAADREKVRSQLESHLARATAGIDADLLSEVERLHAVRGVLEADVERLRSWLEEQRASVRQTLLDAATTLERAPLPLGEMPGVEPVDPQPRLFPSEDPSPTDDGLTSAVGTVPPEEEALAPGDVDPQPHDEERSSEAI